MVREALLRRESFHHALVAEAANSLPRQQPKPPKTDEQARSPAASLFATANC